MRVKGTMFVLAITLLLAGISCVFAGENTNSSSTKAPTVLLSKPTKGKVKATAAVNADGTIASCLKCNPANTSRLSTGAYQVDFGIAFADISASNGFSRWVQPDTLGDGALATFCTTADRAGTPTAVFVQCMDSTGALADTSFFLFLAR